MHQRVHRGREALIVGAVREARRRGTLIVLLAFTLLVGDGAHGFQPGAATTAATTVAATVAPAAVVGAGPFDKAGCLFCAGTIVAVAGTTIFGFVMAAMLQPDLFGGCAYLCYVAYYK